MLGIYFTKISFESTTTKYYLKLSSFYIFIKLKDRNENIITQNLEAFFLFKSLLNCKIPKDQLFTFILMNLKVLFVAIIFMASCAKNKKTAETYKSVSDEVVHQEIEGNDIQLEVYDYAGFEKFLNKKDDKVYVINFWATWCAPCVKELPYFEKLNSEYKTANVEVILVSLDFPHLYDKKLKPFIKDRKLFSKVIALDDADMNTWIPKVNEKWSGSIPATVIYRNNDKRFYEQSFTFEELEEEVKQFLN